VALGADELLPFARQVLCDLTSLLGAEDSEVRSRLAQLVADRLVADRAERSMAEWRAWVWREFEQAGLDPYAAPAPGPAWPDPDARLAAAPATASPADGRQAERPADLPCNASLAAAAPARQARPPAAAAVLPHRAG
jgi:hypothetical protein